MASTMKSLLKVFVSLVIGGGALAALAQPANTLNATPLITANTAFITRCSNIENMQSKGGGRTFHGNATDDETVFQLFCQSLSAWGLNMQNTTNRQTAKSALTPFSAVVSHKS